jgi:PAS domain S-box-containing protein
MWKLKLRNRILLTLLITFAAALLQWVLWPYINHYGFLLFYPAVFFSSLIDDLRGALISTFLAVLIVWYFFVPPGFSFIIEDKKDIFSFAIFIIIGFSLGFSQSYLSRTINELKITKSNLFESEKKYRRIVETSQDGIVMTTLDGKITFCNRRYAEILGYSVEELTGSSAIQSLHPEEINKIAERREILKTEGMQQGVLRFIRKDGKIVWTLFNSVAVMDENGKYTSNLATHTDITERKRLEDQLEFREKIYTRMVTHLPKSVIYVLDREGRFIQGGGGLLAQICINPEMIIGKKLDEVFPPEVSYFLEPAFARALNGEEATCETILRNYYWLNEFVPVTDQNGNIENILVLSIDITSQKKTETELRIAQKKLNLTLENANIGLWEWDLKTNQVKWDSRMERIFGIEPGKFGQTYSDFENCVNEEDLPHIREAFARTIRKDNPFETIFRTRPVNGMSKYISTKALINKYKNGKPMGLTGVCFDVTSMKKGTEQTLIRLNEELMRSNKDLEQFAYVASHDLQEPLRMVSSFTQMLEQRYRDKLDEDGREFIRYAVEGSKRMYFLINGLLAYSRVNTRGKEFEKVKMNDVLGKVIKNLALKIDEKKVSVVFKNLPVIFADENQMIQLFQNLIENSLKFSKNNTSIHVSVKSDSAYHIFSIKDEGIGIEQQYFERIFKIFQRLNRNYDGTGIGLAICKRIVERHGGYIWVESEPGKGSNFIFTIPKLKSPSPN